jgi:hypothetical protein
MSHPPEQLKHVAHLATAWWHDKLMAGDRTKFSKALYPLVLSDLLNHGMCELDCDYDPRGHLLTAVRSAGLECSGMGFSARGILPAKHSLSVYPDHLEPKEGYGNFLPDIPIPSRDQKSSGDASPGEPPGDA